MAERDVDQTTGIETTGHEWDGIKELNNPLPRWWLWAFYATIAFSIGYIVWYPAIPLIDDSTQGLSGVTNRSLLQTELAEVQTSRKAILAKIEAQDLESIVKDEELVRFSRASGASAFKVYCSQCHGAGAAGGPGYPNLNDDDWLWGGDLQTIYLSIKHGIRNGEDDDARDSIMPAFGDGLLDNGKINAVTEHVLALSGQEHDANLAGTGAALFEQQCASCHGMDGTGGREFGAPNLADAISLYGNTRETIKQQIWAPKHGAMPAWAGRLTEAEIKNLAIYVHGLGGGEAPGAE